MTLNDCICIGVVAASVAGLVCVLCLCWRWR